MAGLAQTDLGEAENSALSARSAWLCLRIPELALQALRPQMLAPPDREQALRLESSGQAKVTGQANATEQAWVVLRKVDSSQIIAVDSQAVALGIGCNHTLAQARAITPKLGVIVRQAMREDALLEDLACVAYQFSHQVVLGKDCAGNASVTLEIAASLNLFGGFTALLNALKPLLATLMLRLQFGIAPNPDGARVLAQSAAVGHVRRARKWPQSLNRIALIHSALAPDTTAALASMGVHNFAALFALPMSGLRKRFGAVCVQYLTALQQTNAAAKFQAGQYWRPPQQFQRQLDFGFSAESVALLAFPIKRLLRELALYLQACDAAVQEITLTLLHQSKPATKLVINMLSVTRDALIFENLVGTKLENLSLAEGVVGICLSAPKLTPGTAHTPDLFSATAGASLPLPRLLERLQNKLGKDFSTDSFANANSLPTHAFANANSLPTHAFANANKANKSNSPDVFSRQKKLDVAAVQTLHWQHEHRPELASRMQPLNAQALMTKPGKSVAVLDETQAMPPRPFWLITPEVIVANAFAILSGPERIESGWWDSAQLGDVRRDYYVAQLHSGTRIWIYQQRPNSKSAAAVIWYLHGYF